MKTIKTYSDFISEQLTGRPTTSQPRQQVRSNTTPPPANTTPPPPSAEEVTKQKANLTAKLDAGFKLLHEWLINMFSSANSGFWAKYKSAWGDNETKAWEGLTTQWGLDCKPTLDDLKKAVTQLNADVAANGKWKDDVQMVTLSKKMTLNLAEVTNWMTSKDDDSLYDTMVTVNDSDDFSWTLNLSTGPISKTIDTDI